MGLLVLERERCSRLMVATTMGIEVSVLMIWVVDESVTDLGAVETVMAGTNPPVRGNTGSDLVTGTS